MIQKCRKFQAKRETKIWLPEKHLHHEFNLHLNKYCFLLLKRISFVRTKNLKQTNRRMKILLEIVWTEYAKKTVLTFNLFLFITFEQREHGTGISGQQFSCSCKITNCLQWLQCDFWYMHDDKCSCKLSLKNFFFGKQAFYFIAWTELKILLVSGDFHRKVNFKSLGSDRILLEVPSSCGISKNLSPSYDLRGGGNI